MFDPDELDRLLLASQGDPASIERFKAEGRAKAYLYANGPEISRMARAVKKLRQGGFTLTDDGRIVLKHPDEIA